MKYKTDSVDFIEHSLTISGLAVGRSQRSPLIARLPEPRDPPPSPGSGRCHDRLALAGLDHHEARAVEGQLEGLARAAANEGAHLEGVLDLRLQVRRPADRRLRVNEGRLLRVGQTRQHPVIGTRYRFILRWCLV